MTTTYEKIKQVILDIDQQLLVLNNPTLQHEMNSEQDYGQLLEQLTVLINNADLSSLELNELEEMLDNQARVINELLGNNFSEVITDESLNEDNANAH